MGWQTWRMPAPITETKKRVADVLTYQHIPVSPLLHVVDQISLRLEVTLQMFDHLVV